jgi:hypothetical protein
VSGVDGSSVEQVGEGRSVRPGPGDERGQEHGCGDGVPQGPMGLAAGREALYLRSEVELGGQGAEAVLGAELEVAGQAEGVDERGRGDRGVAAVQEAPVDADVVADDDVPADAAGELGLDGGGAGGRGQDGGGEAGRDPGTARDAAAGVDEGGVSGGGVGLAGG